MCTGYFNHNRSFKGHELKRRCTTEMISARWQQHLVQRCNVCSCHFYYHRRERPEIVHKRARGEDQKRKQLTVVLVNAERFFSNGPGHGGQSWRLVAIVGLVSKPSSTPYCIGTSFSVAYTGWLNRFTGICSCLALCRSLSGVARRASLLMFPPVSLHIRLHAFHFHLRTCRRWFWSA